MSKILLGVNVDHVATIRQARGTDYPSPLEAALLAEKAGADGITIHLREDRRHIQDSDVELFQEKLTTRLNLEMAVTEEMILIAEHIRPVHCCLVPEKREELTTEGGLDIISQQSKVQEACVRLKKAGVEVSLFIDPNIEQVDAVLSCGAPVIEIHTGGYADAQDGKTKEKALERIISTVEYAHKKGLIVNAGHGLHYENTDAIAKIPNINELNIGHSIIARAVSVGIEKAVKEMIAILKTA